jgi:eukaryotic-like serine/threonine-protein kinase
MIGTTVKEYKILDRLGAGGMGEVFRAVHARTGRVVAIKVLNQAKQSPSFRQRFFNEARVQAQLQHPCIAAVYDLLEHNAQPCIVMEYIDGRTLDEQICLKGILPAESAVSIFRKIVEAIAFVHNNGILHRDIKSNNIKITRTGEVKLLDFGIAKSDASPKLTVTGEVVGTLHYLSPEQINGAPADERSDLWALGVVLYEMVTGQSPFDATTLGRLCDKISRSDYLSPSTVNPTLPKELESIISRCLKKNVTARYQSAEELLADLEELKMVDPAEPALRPMGSFKPSLMQWTSRNWKSGAAVLGVVLCVLLGFWVLPRKPAPGVVPAEPVNHQQQPAGELKAVKVNAAEGKAQVYRDGQLVGQTPYEIRAALGELVRLTLKREGYLDKQVDFAITEGKKEYTVVLSPAN